MCKKLLVLALVLCVAGGASAACIAWWTFDNAASLGEAKIGQTSTNVWGGATQEAGVRGGSLACHGTGYVFYGASWAGEFMESWRQPQFSASYWVKLKDSEGAYAKENLAFSGQQTDYGAWALMSTHVAHAGTGAVCWLYGTDAWFYGYPQIVWFAASRAVYKADFTDFELVTETFDMNFYGPMDGRRQMYIGQTKVDDGRTSCGGIMTPMTYFAIGARPWGSGGGDGLSGNIDELRFYDEVVPEPMTVALLGLGGLFLRRRK